VEPTFDVSGNPSSYYHVRTTNDADNEGDAQDDRDSIGEVEAESGPTVSSYYYKSFSVLAIRLTLINPPGSVAHQHERSDREDTSSPACPEG